MTDALRYASLKRVVALSPSVGSRDIGEFIPQQIRERAFISARTPYAGYLSDVSTQIQRMVQPDVRIMPDGLIPTKSGESISPAQVRARMKRTLAALGYQPDQDKRGGLQDLSSDKRVNLIIDTQMKMARGYGSWRQQQDPTVLDVWPADELYRAINRKEERDWQGRWNDARRSLGSRTTATIAQFQSGPFVAIKNDPIWRAISAFGNPYPPFDFMSGMRVRDVSRRRAEELGVIAPGHKIKPSMDPLNQPVSMAMQDTRPDIADALQSAFGKQAMRDSDGTLHFIADPVKTLAELAYRATQGQQAAGAIAFISPAQQASAARILNSDIPGGATFDIDAAHINHIRNAHGTAAERMRGQIPVTDQDIARLDTIIATGEPRRPTIAELKKPENNDLAFDCADGYIAGGAYSTKHKRLLIRTLYRRAK